MSDSPEDGADPRSPERPAPESSALDELLESLDLVQLDADLFLGDPGPGRGRLFGGVVAAQSFMAAARTVEPERSVHSLHAFFLRPGRHGTPIRFVVDRIRDGRSYTTRRVKAHQSGEAIFNLSASFAIPEEGISHQDPMPPVPAPEGLPDRELSRPRSVGRGGFRSAVEVRMCEDYWLEPERPRPARQRNWMRPIGALPEDRLIHTAVLIYASDRSLLATAAMPHGQIFRRGGMGASLDHAVWIHRRVAMDDWILFTSESPVAHGGRGLILGAIYQPDGVRVASLAQEALIRLARKG